MYVCVCVKRTKMRTEIKKIKNTEKCTLKHCNVDCTPARVLYTHNSLHETNAIFSSSFSSFFSSNTQSLFNNNNKVQREMNFNYNNGNLTINNQKTLKIKFLCLQSMFVLFCGCRSYELYWNDYIDTFDISIH